MKADSSRRVASFPLRTVITTACAVYLANPKSVDIDTGLRSINAAFTLRPSDMRLTITTDVSLKRLISYRSFATKTFAIAEV
jgi:hypothetical protein